MKLKNRYIGIVMVVIATVFSAMATTDYAVLEGKAQRFFDHSEWPSASAMYELMLAQQPKNISVYSRAIVAAGMVNDTAKQVSLLERTENNAIPFDSIFSGVLRVSTNLGETTTYTSFMNLVKIKQPWLVRTIDVRLLDFYTFRSDADNMIITADALLKVTPDNVKFLTDKGLGYTLKGDYINSMDCYRKVLEYDKDNINALLNLGNYHNILVDNELKAIGLTAAQILDKKKKEIILVPVPHQTTINQNTILAITYLKRVYDLKPTPFLKDTIIKLEAVLKCVE